MMAIADEGELLIVDDGNGLRRTDYPGVIPAIVNALEGTIAAGEPVAVIRVQPQFRPLGDLVNRALAGHPRLLTEMLTHVRAALKECNQPTITFVDLVAYFGRRLQETAK
jgi:hypothetical protein